MKNFINRNNLIVLLLLMSMLGVSTILISACNNKNYTNEPNTYIIEFGAQSGGKILGNVHQIVCEGESTQIVIAVADIGYYFAGWADKSRLNDETITQDERIIDNVKEDRFFYAMFEKITLQVTYIVGENGNIEGELVQNVKYGDDTESVTAVPNIGYHFLSWSDGVKEATRKEAELIANKEITAYFELITNTYKYDYKFADSNCDIKSISLTYGQLEDTVFVVPKRTHGLFGGWYADRFLTQQVSDNEGKILIGNEFLYSDCTTLYAKWITENTNTYKILMVYVTELNAELMTKDRSHKVQVNYKMTETEYKICQMLTEKISFELNDLAVADFQVDEYFTKVPLTKENVRESFDAFDGKLDNSMDVEDIPEINGMLDQYDCVMLSYSMNDYVGALYTSGGSGYAHSAQVHFDGCLGQLLYMHEPLEALFDPLHRYWDEILEGYLHEFLHTIEMWINDMFEYHKVLSAYLHDPAWEPLLDQKLYLLNKAIVNGEVVGIPYEFWEGKIATVHYESQVGGRIAYVGTHHNPTRGQNPNDDIQYVLYGNDAITVEARAFDNYEFVEWSDGVKTAIRKDVNILEDLYVHAIFRLVD